MTEPQTSATAVVAPSLEMRGITKRYPGVVANDHIDLTVRPGEIHALLGENGAGKSTLMNILYGLAKPDEGEILLDGQQVDISGPTDAIRRGINMVHQHFMLIPVLTVAENILLGEEELRGRIFLDRRESRRRIRELGERFGFDIDPDEKVGRLSVGWQQRVEILKALYRDARILVLDEPTAVLTPQETEEIFAVLRRLAQDGHSIVFISHKLYEVMAIADRITVIRRGKVVGERLPSATDEDDLAELMVGREVQLTVDRGISHPGDVVLDVRGLEVRNDRGRTVVHGVDLQVRAGEILGIAGVAGNGQDELVEAITGLRRPATGSVTLAGEDVAGSSPRELHDRGIAFVPADRHRYGCILSWSIADNLVLNDYHNEPYSRGVVMDEQAMRERALEAIAQFDIRTPGPNVPMGTLSGGNQQKVVVARELDRDVRLLVLDQPTRGLDVGSVESIHRLTIAKRDSGTAVLLVSAELDEVLELSDRIAVMYRGRIVAVVDGRTAQRDEVGLLMATGGATTPTPTGGATPTPAGDAAR
ncbi:MAG: ABC transporter ATP-binding protein [Chloroflexi bacterium]|nr:ABC transporter ATP-binding protein [Chloroflexota bacterium]